jgi:hypothetical protein
MARNPSKHVISAMDQNPRKHVISAMARNPRAWAIPTTTRIILTVFDFGYFKLRKQAMDSGWEIRVVMAAKEFTLWR